MRRDVLLIVFFLFHSIVNANRIYKDSIVKKVVFVIVDGISTDQLKSSKTPYIDSISLQGSYTDAYVGGGKGTYSETPTISAVGYNSLLTGTWANKHNVWGNSIKLPNYNYPTIFKLFKDKRPKGTIGVFSSWLDNRTKLVGDGLKATNFIKVDYAFDGLENDTINFPHDKRRNFMKLIDYTVADYAAKTIVEKGPDISWVYLEFSDDIGHRYGDSKRFKAAVSFEDKLVGKIWNAIKKREQLNNEEWLLIVTTDHGRNKKEGKDHGGQSHRERSTWIVMNTKKTNSYFKNYTPAVVDIFPTVADFLNLEIPINTRRELDGVSLTNPVDVINLKAKKEKDSFLITWKSLVKKGRAKLYFSKYNKAKYGEIDKYEYITSVSLEEEQVRIPIERIPNGFGKIILETSNTILNTWLVKLKKP